ncbi:MAG: hypothetical protein KA319_07290 [Ferruginibacter sp.]|nr:hypothetical protein [Ferruginibacter sp.]
MKMIISLFAFALFCTITAQAKIWRVNNNSGITADFTTLQAAHDAATSGDTIHLEPSIATYGNLTMTKKLAIFSIGQFNSNNPGYQQSPAQSFCGNITINNDGANGSLISVRTEGEITISGATVANISIINTAGMAPSMHWCFGVAGAINISGADNCIISKSWSARISISSGANNTIISNNLIGNGLNVDATSSAIVSQNVIYAVAVDNNCLTPSINNSTVTNNIFNKGGTSSFPNSTVSFNMSSGTNLPTGNGNVNNVDMSTVFVDNNGGFIDNVYQLKAGSPAIAAGISGEDLGAFGGTSPFVLAVQPSIPSIYKLQVPATPSGNSMNVIFSTRSN